MDNKKTTPNYATLQSDFVAEARSLFKAQETEITQRNEKILERDDYIYGDRLERTIKVPTGHDATPVNWLRRTVEIHKNMFMGRGFKVLSTYDSGDDSSSENQEERTRIEIENQAKKAAAEARMNLCNAIIRDNGGDTFFNTLAENASAVGDSAIKAYYDEEEDKYKLCHIESIENLYALWEKDNFREVEAYAFIFQVTKQSAISEYGAPKDVATSPLGRPLDTISATGSTIVGDRSYSQPMVTILEITGKVQGWGSKNGKVMRVKVGEENELNVTIVGDTITKLIDDKKKIPKYYILPNKRQRRRPWGVSDVSDAAININLTYIETLSDWRTLASKINFQKFKAFGFDQGVQLPRPEPRKVEYIPLGEGQDVVPLLTGDANGIDWQRQLDECKEQFVRETGISRVLFDDPSVTLNSNQALLTSMKPTSDIAEAKKQLWTPILIEIFTDALETIALWKQDIKDLVPDNEDWSLKIMWPSVMQKEDPVYQSMLLNRFNAGTMSLQSYLEAQGENKEEIDRIRDEMNDPVTAAILGHQLPAFAGVVIQSATADILASLAAAYPEIFNQQQGAGNQQGINSNGGTAAQVSAGNAATGGIGAQPVSQPGSGASATTPGGALAQTNQNAGG